ncbi:hypothetical protein RFI_18265 [Reticulomyxa filosa]|uniref:Uncharacterized protein n=1 Tax=Reticulomyxa filosa TaxID=46433 RepID=X6N0X6_RETFI|nr:hypothetical protein RFI_18265 [Reticulomyxa filosa]|eukprot:ETO18977.1 hypothetical protein RFI_18265 [Reticulomyxa filosa]
MNRMSKFSNSKVFTNFLTSLFKHAAAIRKLILSNHENMSKLRQELTVCKMLFLLVSERNKLIMDHFGEMVGLQLEWTQLLELKADQVEWLFVMRQLESQVKKMESETQQIHRKLREKTVEIEKSNQHIEKLMDENGRLSEDVRRLKTGQMDMQKEYQLNVQKLQYQQETNEKRLYEQILQAKTEKFDDTEKLQKKCDLLQQRVSDLETQKKKQVDTLEKKLKAATEEKTGLRQSIDEFTAQRDDLQSKLDTFRQKYDSLKKICQNLTAQTHASQQDADTWVRFFLFFLAILS